MKTKFQAKNTSPHIGAILKEFIKKHNIYKSALARRLQRSASTIEYYTNSPALQSAIIWELSVALKHNFFADLAAQLPQEFTTNVPVDTSKEEEIARLSDENKVLKAKLETLKEVLKNK